MQLTQEDLDEFKVIYRREFNTELTDAEALRTAHAALNLVQAVCRPLPPEAEKVLLVEDLATILALRAISVQQQIALIDQIIAHQSLNIIHMSG